MKCSSLHCLRFPESGFSDRVKRGFLATEEEAPAVRKPLGPAMTGGVVSKSPGFTRTCRQKNQLGGSGRRTGDLPFTVRRHADRLPVSQTNRLGVTDLSQVDRVLRSSAFTLLIEEQRLAIGRELRGIRVVEPGEIPFLGFPDGDTYEFPAPGVAGEQNPPAVNGSSATSCPFRSATTR